VGVKAEPIAQAAEAARLGRLIVFPTDTVYGLGTRPDEPEATDRVFAAKGRAWELELPVLTASTREARVVAAFDERAEALAVGCWPGALTLVLPRTPSSRGWELGGDPETIGVRVPHHPLALALLAATGPLAVTSANRSGRPPAVSCEELTASFGDDVDVYLCQDEPLHGTASTVVDLAHGPVRILRAGELGRAALSRSLGPGERLLDSPLSP
jgi:L-threonylcarbamoyladenylate synthase